MSQLVFTIQNIRINNRISMRWRKKNRQKENLNTRRVNNIYWILHQNILTPTETKKSQKQKSMNTDYFFSTLASKFNIKLKKNCIIASNLPHHNCFMNDWIGFELKLILEFHLNDLERKSLKIHHMNRSHSRFST